MKQQQTPQAAPLNRRAILGGTGVVAAAAAVVTVLRADDAEAFQATPAQKAGRYRESEHVKRFYALNRR
jgi:hypothetical protein